MRTRLLFGSAALHAGVACGLGLWIGAGLLAERRPPARISFESPRQAAASDELPPDVLSPEENVPVQVETVTEPPACVQEPAALSPASDPAASFEPEAPPAEAAARADAATSGVPLSAAAAVLDPPLDPFESVRPATVEAVMDVAAERVPPPKPKAAAAQPVRPEPPSFVAARLLDGHNKPPAYPRDSVRRHEEGSLRIAVSIAADGSVIEVELLRPSFFPRLNRSAVDAAKAWRFAPAMRAGRAVEACREFAIEFEIAADRGRGRVSS